MESTDLDMDEIFDDNDIDEDIGATGVIPDLDPTQSQDNEEDENAEVLARLKDLSKGAAKKVVRKPQPKLDATRLTGERGIPILPKLFKDVKFKGKGHEAHDLAILMRQMEHWSHRLFPKMPFDEVIERVEKLGSKKEVQTCIKKIRLDMPVLAEDFVGSDREDDDVVRRGDSEDDVVRGGDYEPEISARDEMQGEVRAEDMWDELLREEAEITESQVETEPTYTATKTSSHANSVAIDTPATPVQTGGKTNSAGMTPEMLERIERNKQLALEKRLKKMGHLTPGSKLANSLLSSQTPTKTNTINNVKSPEAKQTENSSENMTVDSERNSEKEEQDSQVINGKLSTDSAREMSEVEKCPSQNVRVDGDSEMSEVIEKGTSQNITVDGKPKENAQHWHTGAASHLDTGLQLDSQTESMDKENTDVVVDNCSNSKEMSEIIENQNGDCLQGLSQSSVESLAMSEVIEPIENEKIVLKEKVNNTANNTSVLTDIGSKKFIATNDEIDGKMSNDKIISDGSVGKENTETDTVDMTGDHCKLKEVDQFDDDLTEDQLMETLEY